MSKLRKAILIIGILVIAVAASLGTALALYATGTIKTDPIELEFKLKEPQEAKVYDGTPLKLSRVNFDDPYNSDIELSKGKLAKGHSIKVEFVGSQTDVGTSECDANIKIYDENGFNVTNEYSIKVIGASLKVVQKAISVELPAQKVVYNGSKVQFNEYKIADNSDGGLCLGHRIYGSANAELMNVGDTLPEDLTPLIFDAAGNDVTANYAIDFNLGDVEIEVIPRPVTVRPVSFEKVYDGEELLADEIEFVEGSLVEGQTVEYVINDGYGNKLTGVGETKTEITSFRIFDTINGEKVDVTENYEFNLKEYSGSLKVTPRPLTIVGKSATFVYNGDEQSIKSDTKPESVEGLVDGEELHSVSYDGARTNVGVSVNRIREVAMKGADNYDISVIHGTLEITPFEMTFKTDSSEKYYDGDVLFNENSECTLAKKGHKIVMAQGSILPTIINVGEVSNAYEVSVVDENNGNADCTPNYAITYDYGTLTVKRLSVEVTLNNRADNREKVNYDGKIHTPTLGVDDADSEYFAVKPILKEGEGTVKCTLGYTDFELVTETRTMRDAGTYYYSVKFKDGTQEERQLYSNYELFVPESGALEIEPLPVAVTLKEYSGDAAFTYSGSVLKVKEIEAIQIIEPADDVELPDDVEFEKLLSKEDFTIVTREVKTDKDKKYTVPLNEIIDAGENYIYTVKIADGSIAKNFAVSVKNSEEDVKGVKLIVKPMSVTITLADVEHTYNGELQTVGLDETFVKMEKTKALSADDDVTETGLPVSCLTVIYKDTDRTDCGGYKFDVKISDAKKKLQNNYELKIVNSDDAEKQVAMLTVKQFELEVTTDTCEFIYNGELQTSGEFTFNALANEGHKIVIAKNDEGKIVLPAVQNVKDTAVNDFTVEIYKNASFTEENKVTKNYNIDYKKGTLSVKHRPITVTTDTPEQPHVYDGNPFSSAKAKITQGLKSEDGAEDLSGRFRARNVGSYSITDVSKEQNVFECEIVLDGNDVTENFEITYEYGWLEVVRCPIKVIAGYTEAGNLVQKAYDGTPLSNDAAVIVNEDLQDKYVARRAGAEPFSIVNAGTVTNEFECAIFTKSNFDVSGNFDIEYEYGTLKITPVKATISLSKFTYEDAFSYDDETDKVDMTYNGKRKTFTAQQAIEGIKINNKKFTVGKDKQAGKGIVFAESDFEIEYSSDIINVGRYTYSVKFTDEAFKNNFIFDDEEVQFSCPVYVKQKELKVELKDFTGDHAFTFDNRLHEIDIYKNGVDRVVNIVDGEDDVLDYDSKLLSVREFTVVYPEQLFNAGTYTYEVKIENEDFAKNFLLSGTVGNVEINQFDVYVSLKDFTTEYSGEEFVFVNADAISIGEDAVNAETALSDLISSADFFFEEKDGLSIKNAGEYDYVAKFIDEINARNFNVIVDTEYGYNATVVIEKAKAKVSLEDVKMTFNNKVQTIDKASAIKTVDNDLLTAEDFDIEVTGGETQLFKAGNYSFKAILTNENFDLVDDDGNIIDDRTLSGGKVVMAQYELTITLNDLGKEYDGKDYCFENEAVFAEFEDGLFAIGDFEITYDDELTEHADADVYTLKAVLIAEYDEIKDSVDIVTENNLLRIVKKSLTITTPTDTFEYDGSQKTTEKLPGLDGVVEGHYAVVDADTVLKVTNVAADPYENTVKYLIYSKTTDEDGNETEKNETENYEITYVNGTLTVTPRAVTVKTGSANREYNGAPLTCDTIAEAEGLLTGHSCYPATEVLPERTDIGETKNEFGVMIVVEADDSDVTTNYAITYEYGDLIVEAVAIKVEFKNDVEVDYTGKDVNLSGEDVIGLITRVKNTPGAPAPAVNDFAVIFEGEAVNAGTYSFTVRVKSDCNPDLYDVQDATGSVTVNPVKITVTLKDYEETYDGKIHTVKVTDAVVGIMNEDGEATGLLTAMDLSAVYDYDMILVNNYHEKLAKDEVYNGEIDEIDGIKYKVLTPDEYTYGVEVADPVMAGNFEITVNGGKFTIKKRKLTFSVANVYMSKQEYDENYANEYSIDVTENVSVSTNTPLAEGDHLIINGAVAERTLLTYMTFYLNAFLDGEIELTHMDCYEFTNVNGDDEKSATVQLITY